MKKEKAKQKAKMRWDGFGAPLELKKESIKLSQNPVALQTFLLSAAEIPEKSSTGKITYIVGTRISCSFFFVCVCVLV